DALAGPLPERALFSGRLAFVRHRDDRRPVRREWFLSRTQIGPASPDAACQERTWDPIEDAMALGWPRLTGRLTAVGERWAGTRVESRCNRLACYNPEQNRGGIEAGTPPCVSMSWDERLVGIHRLPSGAPAAVIEGAWNDGHPEGVGVSTERTAVVELRTGRLLHAEVAIHHSILGVERRLEIDAVDSCAGSLAESGWTPAPALAEAVSTATARFEPAPERRATKRVTSGAAPTFTVTPRAPAPATNTAAPDRSAPLITTPASDTAAPDGRAPETTSNGTAPDGSAPASPTPAGDAAAPNGSAPNGNAPELTTPATNTAPAEEAAPAPRQEQDNG
ncbi:MAG: hypothetical protein KC468_36075, partial [Myxococcales bacterium]|nr:hypothetical protein [Myxococcales bacterium]